MTSSRKSKPDDVRLIRDDTADWAERVSAISRVAADGLEHLEADVARLLDHEWEDLRSEALATLVMFWRKEKYLPIALRMLSEDPSKFARHHAAAILTHYARTTGRAREQILRALGRVVQQDPETFVVSEAYAGMVQLLAPERGTSRLRDDFVRDRDVDWELIAPYLPN